MPNEQARFLYIEDDETNCEVMKLLLVDMLDYEQLVIFKDTANILERLRKYTEGFTIIFLDLNIAPLDGYSVCHLLRQDKQYQDQTIISVTASGSPKELRKMRNAGFNGMLAKPLSFDSFPQHLQRIMQGETVWEGI